MLMERQPLSVSENMGARLQEPLPDLGETTSRFNQLAKAFGQDIEEMPTKQRLLSVAKGLGALAFVAANIAHVRALGTPLELNVAHETNPAVGGLAGAVMHLGWFGLYSH